MHDYRDTCVELTKLDCKATVSSFVHEVCYDRTNRYLVIMLQKTRYHYCNIPDDVVKALLSADSHGKYYNSRIKGNFGCQGITAPTY